MTVNNVIKDASYNSNSSGSIEKAFNPFEKVPKYVLLHMLTFVDLKDLGHCCLVSKLWKERASDPYVWKERNIREISSSRLKVFDESDWKGRFKLSDNGLSVDDVSWLNIRESISILNQCLSSLSIEGNAGLTLLTIPKGLTLNKLVELAESLTENAVEFENIYSPILEKFGNVPVENTYKLLITNNVLEKSRDSDVNDQKQLVSEKGCELPKVLEAVTLLVVTYMRDQKCLYSETHTNCQEEVYDETTRVGDFGSDGIDISSNAYINPACGAGAVLRFKERD